MKSRLFKHLLALASMALLAVAPAEALTPSQAFVNAPASLYPTLDRNTRLDMVDYFTGGLSTESKNALGGGSAITDMTDRSITIKLTDASTSTLAILPAEGDTLVAVITTIQSPAPDSRMTIYDKSWSSSATAKAFVRPVLSDWLTAEGRKNAKTVESVVPFLLIDYVYDPSTSELTMNNNTRLFLSDEVYAIVSPYLLKQLKYRWNGKRFVSSK